MWPPKTQSNLLRSAIKEVYLITFLISESYKGSTFRLKKNPNIFSYLKSDMFCILEKLDILLESINFLHISSVKWR